MQLAVLIAVGPEEGDLARLADLLASISFYEPNIHEVVLIDDAKAARRIPQSSNFRITSLLNPRQGKGIGNLGGLWTGLATGYRWIEANLAGACALKLDLDALVIGAFANDLSAELAQRKDAGLIGCVGETSNRSEPLFQACLRRRASLRMAPDAIAALETQLRAAPEGGLTLQWGGKTATVTGEQCQSFIKTKPHIERAIANGFDSGEYCQGGAYVMTPEMLSRMRLQGFLDEPEMWMSLPFGEDMIAAMYCRAVHLRIVDFSDTGQAFGIRYEGLPAAPADLILGRHSIIHSLRNHKGWTENGLRQFFRARRSAEVGPAKIHSAVATVHGLM